MSRRLSRRALLKYGLAALAARPASARSRDTDAPEIRDVLKMLGLGPIREEAHGSYHVVGDAPAPFLEAALRLCEGLENDYLTHFQTRGFTVARTKARLVVVALAGPESYATFMGAPQDGAVGGHYDRRTNRLVIFDNRARADANPLAARLNTISLMHEATHQLTFNTGLLERDGDVPLCISEGLGMYGEVRRPDGRTKLGAPNLPRREEARHAGVPDLESLLTDEALFERAETQNTAYAQSWLLVDHLMRDPRRRPRFQFYLERIRPRRDPGRRLEDARAAFDDLNVLARELRR